MITRQIAGVVFNVTSPSFYQLACEPRVEIAFVGDQWQLFCPGADGEPLCEGFPSLDDAAGRIALALCC